MALRPLLSALVATLLLLVAAPAQAATEATSSASAERTLVQLINDRREAAGAPPLTARADLHDVARDWSFTQAERGELGHNPNLSDQTCCWTKIAENVARSGGQGGGDATAAARALMDLWRSSPSHDQTMTDPELDQVGLGVVVDDDGTAWGTAVFRRCDGSSCVGGTQGPAGDRTVSWAPPPPPPAPEPEPEPEPAPTLPEEPTPTASASPSPSPSPSPSSSPSPPPSAEPTPSPSPSPSPTPDRATTTDLASEPSRAGVEATALLVVVAAALALASAVATHRRS